MRQILPLVFAASAFAAFNTISPETEGMEGVFLGNGTYLTAGPTYVWARPSGSDGIHSAGELWSPEKATQRLLINRYSATPSWEIKEASVWLSTGNEIGDMIYQDLLTTDNVNNRTPLLEAGFRSPSIGGFYATARYFQVDHYSSRNQKVREARVGGAEYSWFGENLPYFSTAYGGLGYEGKDFSASVVAGKEYLWLYSESGRWIPVTYSPRVEARAAYRGLSAIVTIENGEYEDDSKDESGEQLEVAGTLRYACDSTCVKGVFHAGAGASFRAIDSDGDVYFGLEEDFVAWPFLEFRLTPFKRMSAAANIGANERDWLLQDSVEYTFKPAYRTAILVGIGNRAGTRLNPLGDTEEYFDGDTISLAPSGYFQIHRAYAEATQDLAPFAFGAKVVGFAEEGAETFDTLYTNDSSTEPTRVGDVSRIDPWIYGVSGELSVSFTFRQLFRLEAVGGLEHIHGPEKRFEVNPAEGWVVFRGYWNFGDYLRVAQAFNYRSDARWNLRSSDPLVVKGSWYWNLTAEQNFPGYGLALTGTLLHIIGNDKLEVPGGGYDRTRFYCSVKKTF